MTRPVINTTQRVKIMSDPAVYFHLHDATRGLRPRHVSRVSIPASILT